MAKIKINEDIFRTYDIRGVNETDLNEETVEAIGKGFGTYLTQHGTKDCLVGRDTRLTSARFQKTITQALLKTGCNVYDIGLTLASSLYYARHFHKIDGAIMVTASHNPPDYNGFKLCQGINAIVEEEIQKLKRIILSGKFAEGQGKLINLPQANDEYYRAIKERVKVKKPLKVVVDCGHSTPALFIPKFLEDLGCQVITIHGEIDSSFPAGVPDPVNPEFCKHTMEAVLKEKADFGVVMDADGDRAGFVDEKGRMWMGDIILDLLLRDMLPQQKGAKVIVEIKDSEIVVEDTQRLGGIPIFWKTGHALLDHKVYEEKALLCGEMSCHYWVTKDWYCFDDAVMAMTQLLRIVSESDKTFGEIIDEIPKYPSTPEYRIACPEEKKEEIVEKAVQYFKNKCSKAITIDGIRGYIYDGWFLFRKSNTQPILSIRCEAKTQAGLEKIKKFIKAHIDTYKPDIDLDWTRQYDIK
ncbi:hypothetical protein A2160_04945 [Candidatus Beckwithbacteria bacterium RBG_13_42_9]|uniref:Phosphomannomutase n=1 Tax=Candidatus Beckwithbacteria bacterium RBG_13_42_9 TaxID=1797457 RepID=A0A1F5E5N4_9BACT|nr:MAG: hypothetical protein A2160_04945 [Candidatus Beckwithbacteria bacterium RBG_13_42_9]